MSSLPFGFTTEDNCLLTLHGKQQLVVLTADKFECECRYEAEDGTFADALFRFTGKTSGTIRLSMLQLSDPQEFKKALLTQFKPEENAIPLTTIITETSNTKLIVETLNALIRYFKELYADCKLYTSLRPGIGDVTHNVDRSEISERLLDAKDFSIWHGGNQVLLTYWRKDKYEYKQLAFSKTISEFRHKQFQLNPIEERLIGGFGIYPDELKSGIANLIKFYQFTGGMMAAWALVASYYKDLMAKQIKIPLIYFFGNTQDGKSSAASTIHSMFGLYGSLASQIFQGSGISKATTVFMDRLFGSVDGVHAIPAILDEADKNQKNYTASEIQDMILAIYDGNGRGQGTRSQTGTHKTIYQTTAIVAGIDLPAKSEALNRCFIVDMKNVSKEHNLEYERKFKDNLKPLSAFIFEAKKTISHRHLIQRYFEIRENVFGELKKLGVTNRETSTLALVKAGYELLVESKLLPNGLVPEKAWYEQIGIMQERSKAIDLPEQLLRMALDVAGKKIGFVDWRDYIVYQDFAFVSQPYYKLTIKLGKEAKSHTSFKMLAEYYCQETKKQIEGDRVLSALKMHPFLVKDKNGKSCEQICRCWKENVIVSESVLRYNIDEYRNNNGQGVASINGINERCMVFNIPYEPDVRLTSDEDTENEEISESQKKRDMEEAPLPEELKQDISQEEVPF